MDLFSCLTENYWLLFNVLESVSTSTTANQHLAHIPVDPHTQSTLNEPLVKQQQLQSHQQLPSFSNYWPTVTEFGVSYKSKVSIPHQNKNSVD